MKQSVERICLCVDDFNTCYMCQSRELADKFKKLPLEYQLLINKYVAMINRNQFDDMDQVKYFLALSNQLSELELDDYILAI